MTTEPVNSDLKPEKRPPERVPDLIELVFDGRNKAYGSFDIRRKYLRYLLVATVCGVLIFLAAVFVPFMVLYFEGPLLIDTTEALYEVDYAFFAPPGDDLNELAQQIAVKQEEFTGPPVVVDSVPLPKKTEQQKVNEEEPTPDSASPGRSSLGKGISEEGTGNGDGDGIYTTIDVYPRFPGGDQARIYFLRTHIRYPEIALKMGVEGTILAVFVVETDGRVTNVEIARGINKYCDEEAIRVIRSMPDWEPGKRAGRPVRVLVRMPIIFKIPNRK